MIPSQRHIALFFSGFSSGGVPRVMLTLAHALATRGHQVDVVVVRSQGPSRPMLSPLVRLIELSDWRTRLPWIAWKGRRQVMASIPALTNYLRRERPDALLSAGNYANISALPAQAIARTCVRVAISQHIHLSKEAEQKPFIRWLTRRNFPRADAIVAVSNGVADDLSVATDLAREKITTIYNPVVTPELLEKAQAPLDHSWFVPGSPPVVLGAGRLQNQKDFPTLLRAFARLRAAREARLLILGQAKNVRYRTHLMELAHQLGIANDVALPGFVDNPYAYMARARVFALSSAWEGFGNVLVEAMACGCPVVSTDCPSGPAEILDSGKYGPLVPVGDDEALADAMLSVLKAPPHQECLRTRAAMFSVDHAAEQYLGILLGDTTAEKI